MQRHYQCQLVCQPGVGATGSMPAVHPVQKVADAPNKFLATSERYSARRRVQPPRVRACVRAGHGAPHQQGCSVVAFTLSCSQ